MDSNKNCGKSSAIKKLKGFTIVELLIVMAILSILAGMISIVTSGLVRDARLESARNTAQEVYTGIQNALVQMEIKQQSDLLNPVTYGETGTFSNYVTLCFIMENGAISKSNYLTLSGDNTNFAFSDGTMESKLLYDYPNAVAASDDKEKAFRKLAKYIVDNLSMDFTGYVYAAIDMEDWVVDSVVYIEDYNKVKNSTNGIADFVPMFKTKSSGSTNIMTASNSRIPFCKDIFAQKRIYSGKPSDPDDAATLLPEAAGTAVGYYPLYADIEDSTTVAYT